MSNILLERLSRHFTEKHDKTVLKYSSGTSVTYGELDILSGKIAAYLRSSGFGKEDRIVILMPRGIEIIIAMVGIWRAGCSLIVCESNMAADRVRYIAADSECVLTVTESVYREMLRSDYRPEIADPDPHDAAYLVYTSGTTGNPKGVLHEYGNMDEAVRAKQYNGSPIPRETDTVAINSPLNFVAGVDYIINLLAAGGTILLMDMKDVKNSAALLKTYAENHVTCTFMTPSLFRSVPKFNAELDWVILGGEPCVNLYSDTIRLFNGYNLSEAGRDMFLFPIDQPFGLTPVGVNRGGETVVLLDEEGKEITGEASGEVCFPNRFVRGYIGAAFGQTAEKWKNGLFHTGDIAKRLPDGNFVLQGRNDDMIKINGNRIEPAEIENTAKRELHLEWACAKGFILPDRAFVVLYYKDPKVLDPEEARSVLAGSLTSYMVPSYFVRIDEIPLLPTGKLDKKKLLPPDVNAFKKAYAAPETEIEKKLTAVFEKVLGIQHMGVNDDFYELGGDSLRSMEAIVELDDPVLNVNAIYQNRTVRKIAAYYTEHQEEAGKPDQINAESLLRDHPLTTEQIYMVDYQLYTPKSTMYNLYNMLKFDRTRVDMERLTDAVNRSLRRHPVFMTSFFFDEDGDLRQKYTSANFEEVSLEKVTEAELAEISRNLVRPFKIINSRLVRTRLFETEAAGYLFFDVHHTIFDGTSFKNFYTNILEFYNGKTPAKDYYYYILDKRETQFGSPFFEESKAYFESRYGGKDWCRHISTDRTTFENTDNEIDFLLPVSGEQLSEISARYSLSPNGFFIASAALANAVYENKDDIMLSWIYNGRSEMSEMSSIGLLFRNLCVGVSLKELGSLRALYSDVSDQIEKGIEHSCYPYVETNNNVVEDDLTCVLYQDNLVNMIPLPGLTEEMKLENKSLASQNIMDLHIINKNGDLMLKVDYASSLYTLETVRKYQDIFCSVVRTLAAHIDHADAGMDEILAEIRGQLNH